MKTIRLVTRADDAGSARSANEAVEETVNAGAVRNASLMICGPAFEDAARRFAGRDDVCLGLHVVLNAEWAGPRWGPVLGAAAVPSLVEPGTGYFTSTPRVLHDRGFSVEEAVAEVAAQLNRARRAGLNLRYLDEHMGVGWIWGLRPALADLARREGLIEASSLSLSHMPKLPDDAAVPEGADDAETLVDRWLAALDLATPGETYLLVTHPGKDAPDMREFYLEGGTPGAIARERDRERRALAHPRFREGCAARGVVLTRYDEVRTGTPAGSENP